MSIFLKSEGPLGSMILSTVVQVLCKPQDIRIVAMISDSSYTWSRHQIILQHLEIGFNVKGSGWCEACSMGGGEPGHRIGWQAWRPWTQAPCTSAPAAQFPWCTPAAVNKHRVIFVVDYLMIACDRYLQCSCREIKRLRILEWIACQWCAINCVRACVCVGGGSGEKEELRWSQLGARRELPNCLQSTDARMALDPALFRLRSPAQCSQVAVPTRIRTVN